VLPRVKDETASGSEPKELYPPHLGLGEIQKRMKSHKCVQGKFQLSRDNCFEGYVNVYDNEQQVCMLGMFS